MDWFVNWLDSWAQNSSFRNILKLILRQVTGKCEIERICESGDAKPKEMRRIENSLYHSKYPEIRRIVVADDMKVKSALEIVFIKKRMIPDEHPNLMKTLPIFLAKLLSYNKLMTKVDEIRSDPYDEDNELHEKLLMDLWTILKPDEELESRHTKQWGEIGFQGNNPATDFRGMGILSLKNLIFFLENENEEAKRLFSLSQHPRFGYPFAVAGINLTGVLFDLLRSGKLKAYFYTTNDTKYTLKDFQKLFCQIFCAFSQFYILSEPENIMEFNELLNKYKATIAARLEKGDSDSLANGKFLQV
eukprot:Seg6984.1 transcript_id=Seg6984.1/GoldUCD/mRNA.D3Y31 product="ELMO domain-containing protein 1" protein_id=Seg6984.1/GoldUCD/D3Y31